MLSGRMTLKDIQPQVVDALDGFLAELKSEEVKASRINVGSRFQKPPTQRFPYRRPQRPNTRDICRLCRAEGRTAYHKLVDCDHITPAENRSLVGRACDVSADIDTLALEEEECEYMEETQE